MKTWEISSNGSMVKISGDRVEVTEVAIQFLREARVVAAFRHWEWFREMDAS